MNTGKLVFAQLMDHLPLHIFRRCVAKYPGRYPTLTFSHLDQFLCMAFAQLTYRESLRDIETCLRAHSTKLYHLGIRGGIARSTLADANESRDWRIYQDFALSLIQTARKLYAEDRFGLELTHTVYALDSTTIDLCLALFPWARFRKRKGAVKLHTLLDLRGNIPTFIHISDGKLHDVNILDQIVFEAGSFYVMIGATSISPGSMPCIWLKLSLLRAPNPTFNIGGSIRIPSTKRPVCVATRPSC